MRLKMLAISQSIMFNPIYGFGGNSFGPNYVICGHCIDRAISDGLSERSSQS
ncbi:hypothetical protein BKA67DRAFT_573625 [Truncatella angustata]|uniref:Uncharacterized protein n=1 Tax=Truncatella angustata TaxID=152316 RepID=A0A9P8UHN9_9PEZI|nr:uncharacterized protein BKA67DRAFT_573625 [Truncatella angustata]KAH6652343.1 hypothetical protein BKA67DRAFT_573625 [Truncatella angustata]